MKKKFIRRIATIGVAGALCVGACAMFTGCSSNHPEVTITYTFGEDNTEYKVTYVLSRVDAPNTVQHFIELAKAGFYDGLCIHDYSSDYMYSGGYTLNEDGELEAVNYFERVEELEKAQNKKFTQTVWKNNADRTPLYTVYGEFEKNGNKPQNGRENHYRKGALVMYYTDKTDNNGADLVNEKVITVRNDGGKDNDGDPYNVMSYPYNSATSLFYTYLGDSSSLNNYCIFGKVKNWDDMQALLDAIKDYIDEQTPETEDDGDEADNTYSFTEERTDDNVNRYEPYDELSRGDFSATYQTPVEMPILIKSVKVNKY